MMKHVLTAMVATGLLAGCTRQPPPAPHPRIISHSPSVTDILYDLGLGDHLVGITGWCMVPPGQQRPMSIGGAFDANRELILWLQPDVIFTWERAPTLSPELQKALPAVKVLNVYADSVPQILATIRAVGAATGATVAAELLAEEIDARLEAVRQAHAASPRPSVLFVMGYDHPATTGPGTYLDDLIGLAGGSNAAAPYYDQPWPSVNLEMIDKMAPAVLICQVADERDVEPARAYWRGRAALPAVRDGRVYITTDRRLTIPGSRVADVAEQLARWIHGAPAAATAPAAGHAAGAP